MITGIGSAAQPKHISFGALRNGRGDQVALQLQGVVAINLANQSGSEGVLSKAFEQEARRFSKASSGMRLVPFDFHKQCGATRYDRWGVPPCHHHPLSI